MDHPSETGRLIETMSDALHNINSRVNSLRLLQAATNVVAAQPDASVERVWDVAEQLAHTLL